jgi:hypothetical protein
MIMGASIAGAAAESPTPQEVVQRAIDAAGGQDAFGRLGVLVLGVQQEETLSGGDRILDEYTAYFDTSNFGNMRLEMSKGMVVASHAGRGWAIRDGKLDDRRQTPRMALGAIRQRIVPLLLPFSLEMDGVFAKGVEPATFDNEPVWRLTVQFDKLFFISPAMGGDWSIMIRRSDHEVVGAEFLPPIEYRQVETEGVRYRFLQHTRVDGVQLPSNVLLDGIHSDGLETGHVRITKVAPSVQADYDPTLFVNPKVLEVLDQGVPEEGER